jgi:hypothetical protein
VTRRRWRRVRLSRRAVIGLAALGTLIAAADIGVAWRASRIVNRLVRDRVAAVIAAQTGGVYALDFSPVHVNPLFRQVGVDSLTLTTRRALNASRPAPLPGLNFVMRNCTISGVHPLTLMRAGGLDAGSFGCRSGTVTVELPDRKVSGHPGAGKAASHRSDVELLALQRSVRLPIFLPRIRLARVQFPRLVVHLRLIRASGRPTPLEVEQLQWSLSDLVIDPADTAAASRLLFSRSIEVAAANFAAYQHGETAVRVSRLRASLTDSTLEAGGVAYGPTASGAAFMRASRFGRDLVRLAAGNFSAEGVDYGAFLVGRGVRARSVDVDSLRIDVTTDKAVRKDPRSRYGTPQQWVAGLNQSVSVDSLRVSSAAVVYREHSAGRARLGVLRFTGIEALATSLSHRVGRRSSEAPMSLAVRALLQDAGELQVRMLVPLDAPRFELAAHGTLGAMPTAPINAFVVETNALKIGNAQVLGIVFDLHIRNGVSTGTITPRWSGLSVTVTRSGSSGILGAGGFVGGAARGIANAAASMHVRANNPERPASAPRSGAIRQVWAPSETIIAFLWSSLRDGLLLVVKK